MKVRSPVASISATQKPTSRESVRFDGRLDLVAAERVASDHAEWPFAESTGVDRTQPLARPRTHGVVTAARGRQVLGREDVAATPGYLLDAQHDVDHHGIEAEEAWCGAHAITLMSDVRYSM